jgi:hypothetical protein
VRRLLWLLALAGVLGAASGCTSLLSVDQRALLVGLALDRAPSGHGVEVTASWYNSTPAKSVQGQIEPETSGASGASMEEAFHNLQTGTQRHLDFNAVTVVLVGEALARQGLDAPMDYLWRQGFLPESAEVAVARGTAASILNTQPEREPAYRVFTRLDESEYTANGSVPDPLWRFVSRMETPTPAADPWAPLLQATPTTGFRDVGVAIFRRDRLVGELSGGTVAALSWMLKPGGMEDLVLTHLRAHGEPVVFNVLSRRYHLGRAGDRLRLSLYLTVRPMQGYGVRVQERDVRPLERAAALQAFRDAARLLHRLSAAGADPLGFRRLVGTSGWPGTAVELTTRVRIFADERVA